MKKLRTLIALMALLCCSIASAKDFEVDGIYYNILSIWDKTVEVTYRRYDFQQEYSGSVVIPSSVIDNGKTYSVTSIGAWAFEQCSGLKEITIPESVTSIEYGAFEGCSGLKEITIPGSLTSLGGINTYAKSIHIILTDLAAWIKNHPSFSSNNENIHLYLNGEEITELAIPNDVTTVKDKAFLNLTALTSITIPEGMTVIGDEAFMGCSNIKKIVCNASTPPTAYYDTFTGINKEKCVLMVPEGTEALYKEAKRWKDFLVIESIPSAIEQVAGPTADKDDIYDLSGRLVKTQAEGMDGLAPGVYVKNGKKYIVK